MKIFKKTQKKNFLNKYKFLIALDNTTELGNKRQNSNGKPDDFIQINRN